MSENRMVMVTTEYRGVFMGELVEENGTKCTLKNAQMCVHWSSDAHGVFGLATKGPGDGCRIGPPVPQLTLRKVTSVCDVTPEAVERWRAEPWS